MAEDIREKARQFLTQIPPLGQQINSNGPSGALFTKLTGTSHKTMADNWATGGKMTACNGFVGQYGNHLGATVFLGQFELEKLLKKKGKSHAWVPASSGQRPKYGDIFRPTKFHMGVSLDFDGDMWNTAEAGQGGKNTTYDILKRKREPWDASKMIGWCDIELYFSDPSAPALPPDPAPSATGVGFAADWLTGWWNVGWRAQAFYYYFDRDGIVKWTQVLPQDYSKPPVSARDIGYVTLENTNSLSIRWATSGSIEKLSKSPLVNNVMRGTWNDTEVLIAEKL